MSEMIDRIASMVDETEKTEDELFDKWFARWIKDDVEDDVEDDDKDDINVSLNDDVNVPLKDDINVSLNDDVNEDVNDDIKDDVNVPLKDDVNDDIKDDVNVPLNDDVKSDIKDDVKDDINAPTSPHSVRTPHAEVCFTSSSSSSSSASKLTKKQQQQLIKQRTEEIIHNINQQAADYEKAHSSLNIPIHQYIQSDENAKHIAICTDYLLNLLLIPQRNLHRLTMNEYINSVTSFKYDSYDSPNVAIEHSIPEKVVITSRLNAIFSHEFVNPSKGNFHFNDLDKQLLTFLHKHRNLGTLKLEYTMVKAFLCKLIIALNTSCDLALRDNTKPTLGIEFKLAIIPDIESMKKLQSNIGKTFKSWTTILNTLLSIDSDNMIYVHDNNTSLNNKLSVAFNNDFLTEHLLGNMLKCYLPSIAVDYFYAIKAMYIVTRLTSVYLQKQLYHNKTTTDIIQDLYVIGASGIITYENKSFIFKQMPRTLPSYKNGITEITKMYILNHFFTGGQYYLLKMFERCIPVLVNIIQKH